MPITYVEDLPPWTYFGLSCQVLPAGIDAPTYPIANDWITIPLPGLAAAVNLGPQFISETEAGTSAKNTIFGLVDHIYEVYESLAPAARPTTWSVTRQIANSEVDGVATRTYAFRFKMQDGVWPSLTPVIELTNPRVFFGDDYEWIWPDPYATSVRTLTTHPCLAIAQTAPGDGGAGGFSTLGMDDPSPSEYGSAREVIRTLFANFVSTYNGLTEREYNMSMAVANVFDTKLHTFQNYTFTFRMTPWPLFVKPA